MQQFTFSARGRHYTVKTESLGTALSLTNHWTYQPSVVLPSSLTNNKYVLLLNRNKQAGQDETHGEIITSRSSNDLYSFGSETTILDKGDVSNIYDMADARPIWDGSQRHIYVQAIESSGSQANIYEAVGSSLLSSFQWVTDSANHARVIIAGTSGSVGIAEDMQWYNPKFYGLSDYPFMVTYQNWGDPNYPNDAFNYISQDDSTYDYWYGPITSPYLQPSGFEGALIFPDAILLGTLDALRQGNPGIGLQSNCYSSDHRYQYGKGIGFFNNPSNIPYTSPKTGLIFEGTLEGQTSDSNGPRMFRPRLARNEYGYVPAQSSRGYPRIWVTYLYYTNSQINKTSTTNCSFYDSSLSSTQSISVSRLTFTETR